ncbi:MAG: porin [Myxococcales bacterium]|nr:porin [Myxococcales bacterium]
MSHRRVFGRFFLTAMSQGAVSLAQPQPMSSAPGQVEARFGQGVTLRSGDGRFELNLRGRIQTRFTLTAADAQPDGPGTEFAIRRMRLVFQGHALSRAVQYYIQLGLSNRDTESDLRLPVRDAYVTLTRVRDLQLRVGQMKVPFDRQRVVSSSALQFPDRAMVTSELNLDRDVGVQLFSRDLFGLGHRLGYQLGVFGGDGRNRTSQASGLLYVARLELTPMGAFDDYVEADLSRSPRLRLSLGVGVAYNLNTNRAQSTHGATYTLGRFDVRSVELDLHLKWRGLSVISSFIDRRADAAAVSRTVEGALQREYARNMQGWFVQSGLMLWRGLELVARYGQLAPVVLDPATVDPSQRARRELGAGLNYYFEGHALKVQADYFIYAGARWAEAQEHQARVQLQLFY